jgi:putative phage-type endonuclease
MKDDKIINKVIKKIIGSNKAIFPDSKGVLIEIVKDSLEIFFPKLSIETSNIEKYIDQLLIKPKVFCIKSVVDCIISEYNKENCIQIPTFSHNDVRDQFYRKLCDQIVVPREFTSTWSQYKAIEAVPQPEQKSAEWYLMRDNFITASAGAQAIGESKYEKPIELLKQKIGIGKPFGENFNVHHGKKFEKIAILIYESIYNVKVGEFGLVPHMGSPNLGQEIVPFLGASPDGICTCSTLDGKFSPMVGRMLEIKCVTSRVINTQGDEDGVITPHYYWVQVQLQLECCNLEFCDFWQCKLADGNIKKYKVGDEWTQRSIPWTKQEWEDILDDEETVTTHTEGQGLPIEVNPLFKYGCLIELIPIKKDDLPPAHRIEWYGKYIYPTELATTREEKIAWAENMRVNWKTIYPELSTEYKFARVLYWNLSKSHCLLIKRNREWFKEKYPKFKEFWDQVLLYKSNPEKKQELIEQIAREECARQEKKVVREEKKLAKPEPKINYVAMFDSDSD